MPKSSPSGWRITAYCAREKPKKNLAKPAQNPVLGPSFFSLLRLPLPVCPFTQLISEMLRIISPEIPFTPLPLVLMMILLAQ